MRKDMIELARQHTRLGLDAFAALTQVERTRLEQLCEDAMLATGRELDRVARGLGVEVGAFLGGDFGALSMFFRAFDTNLELDALMLETDGQVYGDFCRCVARLAELRARLGEPLPTPGWKAHTFELSPDLLPWQQGHALARQARRVLGLGDSAPIPSMRAFLEGQGVEVLFLRPDRLQARVDGACVSRPVPAVLVNPIYEAAPWRLRATMAHELCHLIFDIVDAEHCFAISPSGSERRARKKRWELFESYPAMEKRANAFAAAFLAPREAIEALLVEHGFAQNPVEGIDLVSGWFGVSNEMVVNQLASLYQWSNEWRQDVLERASRQYSGSFEYDELPSARGLFTGALQALTLSALDEGIISAVEARRYLDIPLTQALPEGRGAPLVSAQNLALKHAFRLLPSELAREGHYPRSVSWTGHGWLVQLEGSEACHMLAHDFSTMREV